MHCVRRDHCLSFNDEFGADVELAVGDRVGDGVGAGGVVVGFEGEGGEQLGVFGGEGETLTGDVL